MAKKRKKKKSVEEMLLIGPKDKEMKDKIKKKCEKKHNGGPVLMLAAGDLLREKGKKA